MLSRGFTGSLPLLSARATVAGDWTSAALAPAAALAVAALLAGDATAVTLGG